MGKIRKRELLEIFDPIGYYVTLASTVLKGQFFVNTNSITSILGDFAFQNRTGPKSPHLFMFPMHHYLIMYQDNASVLFPQSVVVLVA